MTDDPLPLRPARGEPLRCPLDGSRLVEVERAEVMIDACPECRGVWLDRGELDRILVFERRGQTADDDEDFFGEVEGRAGERKHSKGERRDDDERSDKRRRRRSLLEDLFDLG